MFTTMDDFGCTLQELLSFSNLAFWGHISYGYMFIAFLHKAVYGTAMMALTMYSKGLVIIAGIGFYKLLRLIYSKSQRFECLLGTVLWMVSPFIMGLSNYSYNDFATWCLLPLLLFFIFNQDELLVFITGYFFVFTKESSIIIYSFFLLGLYIIEVAKKKKLFHSVERYTIYLIPCFLWLFSYLFISHWNGGGSLILNSGYFLDKLKSFFCVNFNWLVVIVGIFGFGTMICIRNYHIYLEYFFPLITSAVAYIVISGVINTNVNHPRYIDALYAEIYILFTFVPLVLLDIKMPKYIFLISGIVLLSTASFFTIDPVSRVVYDKVKVGNINVITTSKAASDHWVYNRQYENYGYIIDEGINDALNQQNMVIYMPALYENTWFFDAMGYYYEMQDNEEFVRSEFWNTKKKTRMTDANDDNNVIIDIHVVSSKCQINLSDNMNGVIFYTDFAGTNQVEYIKENYNILGENQYERHGWILKSIIFENRT